MLCSLSLASFANFSNGMNDTRFIISIKWNKNSGRCGLLFLFHSNHLLASLLTDIYVICAPFFWRYTYQEQLYVLLCKRWYDCLWCIRFIHAFIASNTASVASDVKIISIGFRVLKMPLVLGNLYRFCGHTIHIQDCYSIAKAEEKKGIIAASTFLSTGVVVNIIHVYGKMHYWI